MPQDNPAKRLLRILEKGKKIPNEKNCREAWAQILGVSASDEAALLGRLGSTMALSSQIVDSLQLIEGVQIDRYTYWAKPINQAFSQSNLDGNWREFKKHIDTHAINYLTMTSDYLSVQAPEPMIPESKLKDILSNARDLIDQIKASDLPISIKEYMLRQLYKICTAVDEYEITGALRISDITENTFGHALMNQGEVKATSGSEPAKMFWTFMARVAVVVTIASGLDQLSATVGKLLPDLNLENEIDISAPFETDSEN